MNLSQRLNPFFIRSAVGFVGLREGSRRRPSQSLLHQVCGWIITAWFIDGERVCLNPFFIRSAVGLDREGAESR